MAFVKNANCLDTLKPHIRSALREAAKDKLAAVLAKIESKQKSLNDPTIKHPASKEALEEDIERLQRAQDFLMRAIEGAPVLGE